MTILVSNVDHIKLLKCTIAQFATDVFSWWITIACLQINVLAITRSSLFFFLLSILSLFVRLVSLQ